ncbi:MAG: hypothetical protein RLZZ511_3467 [Cyanobacteriota bacterium]
MPEKRQKTNLTDDPIDFQVTPAHLPASPVNPLWQKIVAGLVAVIIAVSAIAVFLLAQRLINAQEKFAAQQTAIVNQLITKIDDLQSLSEGQLQTLKENQHKELEAFKQLQETKLQELQNGQTKLLEDLKKNRDAQLKLLKEQVKHLPGAPKPDDDD